MIGRRLPSPQVNHALILLAALFAAAAVWPWLPRQPVHLLPPEGSRLEAAATPAALPPFGRFAAIGERPLFSRSRRPAAVQAGAAAAVLAGQYRLLGVMRVGTLRRALLAKGERSFEIGEGDSIEGWRVERIEEDRLVLLSGSGQAVIKLQPAPETAGVGAPSGALPPGVRRLSQ